MKIKHKSRIITHPVRWLLATILPTVVMGAGVQPSSSANVLSTNYAIVDAGSFYRVWQKAVPVATNQSGEVSYRTHSYTEVGSGLNHLVNGQWVPTDETIQITPTGGLATNGQHQVNFAANINASNAVQVITPDGKVLTTHIMGMCYMDAATGSNVLFADLKDTIGQLVTSNRVVYSNAFNGTDADVRYTYRRAGFEQELVLQEQLPSPADYGLNPATTWLQVWTEFLNPPTPNIVPVEGSSDTLLDFGAMKMIRGKAFLIGGRTSTAEVIKQWRTIQGRTFLIEQVPLTNIVNQLQTLPIRAGATGTTSSGGDSQQIQYRNFPNQLPPLPTLARKSTETLKLVSASQPAQKGLVLDYTTVDMDGSSYTFQGNTTYDVTSVVNIDGPIVIQGGAVLKFYDDQGSPSDGPSSGLVVAYPSGSITCQTGPYQMAVLTTESDCSVGETVNSGPPATATDDYYINVQVGSLPVLDYLRFAYAYTGVYSEEGVSIWDCQFVDCYESIEVPATVSGPDLHNVLFTGGQDAVLCDPSCGDTTGEQITSDMAGYFFNNNTTGNPHLHLTNAIVLGTLNYAPLSGNVFTDHYVLNPTGAFQSAGDGNYYLADNTYRNIGNTNISAAMLAELAEETTYPPLSLADAMTVSTTVYPQAWRNTGVPDYGYHYVPLDYLARCSINGATLTFSNGVALGYYDNFGVSMLDNSQVISQGGPIQRNRLVYNNLVQEQSSNQNFPSDGADAVPISISGTNPTVLLDFTSIYIPQSAGNVIVLTNGSSATGSLTVLNSEIYGAGALWKTHSASTSMPMDFQNNVFQYTSADIASSDSINTYNNLFTSDGSAYVNVSNSASATITNKDNAFDNCDVVRLDGTNGYNAFLNGAATNGNLHPHDIVTSLGWIAGPLGNYYQATNSPLFHEGNPTADQLGLYHYTVTTNETTETNASVTIGYHYVALGTNGLPLDSNGDGIPDYLEDSNGNGIFDTGDLANWQGTSVTDSNGMVALQVFTPLH